MVVNCYEGVVQVDSNELLWKRAQECLMYHHEPVFQMRGVYQNKLVDSNLISEFLWGSVQESLTHLSGQASISKVP